MRVFIHAVFLALAASALGLPAAAQKAYPNNGETLSTAPRAAPAQAPQLQRGTRILNSTVRDTQYRKIGIIRDLVLDSAGGNIVYAVVSFGGVLGVGQRLHAIPWQVIAAAEGGRFFFLHADRETIAQAPAFDKARWPDMGDPQWRADIDRYWSRMAGHGPGGATSLSTESIRPRREGPR